MYQCKKCGVKFPVQLAPCPDGIVGCLVAHYDEHSYTCPNGHRNKPPSIQMGVHEVLGMGVINPRGLVDLEVK